MFDFSQIIDLLRVEPGHGLVQSFLLLMIWFSSMGVKREVASLHAGFDEKKLEDELRFVKIEGRLTALEPKEKL